MQTIRVHLQLYRAMTGSYPSTAQGLAALVSPPSGEPRPSDWRRLLDEVPRDPWGTPYFYRGPKPADPERFTLCSLGPDRVRSADDILDPPPRTKFNPALQRTGTGG